MGCFLFAKYYETEGENLWKKAVHFTVNQQNIIYDLDKSIKRVKELIAKNIKSGNIEIRHNRLKLIGEPDEELADLIRQKNFAYKIHNKNIKWYQIDNKNFNRPFVTIKDVRDAFKTAVSRGTVILNKEEKYLIYLNRRYEFSR